MTRKEEIKEMARTTASHMTSDKDMQVAFADALRRGAEWADEHPRWISVNDELPPIGAIVLVAIPFGGELNVLALSIKDEGDFECLSGMTHWMPMPEAPKSGCSEIPNNCRKKGGEK